MPIVIIFRTKPSDLPSAQAQGTPEKLERKTRSLEKRLLLRHFLTKALEIRRAEVAAEEERRSQAMKEFIRRPPVSPSIQPLNQPEDQPQTSSVASVVEQARQNVVREQENKLEDLLSNDIEDLIDFSSDSPALPLQAPTTGIHVSQDLDGFHGLFMPRQTIPDIADKAASDPPDQHAVFDRTSKQKHLQSPQLASQPQTPDVTMQDADAQHPKLDSMLQPKCAESPLVD